ncbi:disease resistance protein RGA2-like isoform X2 [Typha angustifolia]|uniref:disease resistance protein RGA2-like isoform X2 n=1 Tax=Typha angustifolia TaxID=59011 RepID=UPI003C2B6FCE
MAELSIASAVGWLVSPIIKVMINKTRSYLSSQCNWRLSMENDLKTLETTLMQTLMVVGMAEKRQNFDMSQLTLLHKIKDAVYDAEDFMDELEYFLLKSKVEHKSSMSRLASSSLSIGKRLVGHDKFRSKLAKILKSLDRVRTNTKTFLQMMGAENCDVIQQPEFAQWHITSSFLHEDKVFGRDKECEALIEQLLQIEGNTESNNGYNPAVHPIIGNGGIGKTTVAQLIYNDERIADNFKLRMWVCVSNNFDKIRLTKEILISASDDKSVDLTNFSYNILQEELKKKLDSKKFLLVLDDVWYDEKVGETTNKERWRELLAPLKYAERGSKILVTTRMQLVATMLNSVCPFSLHGLDNKDSWLLFRSYAFGSENPDDHPELQSIGNRIVERLKGSPLVIKVVGGRLSANPNAEEWHRSLKDDVSNDVITMLSLSYKGLPDHLKNCFAYCSLFPKDCLLEPDRLVNMWIAQGFVQPQGSTGLSIEDIGQSYFQDLLSRSFFQILRRGNETYYVMHDLMSDLALYVSEGEYFRLEDNFAKIPPSVRHLSVCSVIVDQLKSICELKKLRSLIFHKKSEFCSNIFKQDDVFKELENVRVLDLSGCCLERLPDTIDHSIHLRYLALQHTYYPLPDSICKLYHLQVLSVHYHQCLSIGRYVSFPRNTSNLTSISHINVDEYIVMLAGMGKLPCLQGAGELRVERKRGHSIEELKNMNKLRRKLAIKFLENVESRQEAVEAQLDHKGHITKLHLEWGSSARTSVSDKDTEVLEVLRPHPSLEDLIIVGYPGTKSPTWLKSDWLNRLQYVHLHDCRGWKLIPPFGQLPLLKSLKITRMNAVKRVGHEFYGSGMVTGFPSLQELCFADMPELVEWPRTENISLFPCLRTLSITGCPKLSEFPPCLPTLVDIDISAVYCIKLSTNGWSIDSVKPLTALEASTCIFLDVLHLHHLESIQDAVIHFGGGPLPKSGFQVLKSLENLRLHGCTEPLDTALTQVKGEDGSAALPPSLVSLELSECALTENLFSNLLQNLCLLSVLRLQGCSILSTSESALSLHQLAKLKNLYIFGCDGLTSLAGSGVLVSLRSLEIASCPELILLPGLDKLPALEKLIVRNCPQVEALPTNGHPAVLKELLFENCDRLVSLEELQDIVFLRKMEIRNCAKLTTLPKLDIFFSLEILIIQQCPELKSLPENGLPESFQALFLHGCHPTLQEQFHQMKGPEWDKFAVLPKRFYYTGGSRQHIEDMASTMYVELELQQYLNAE